MNWRDVQPVCDPSVIRSLCQKRYPGHPKGCPNFGKRLTCPPAARLLGEIIDLAKPVWAIWNAFEIGRHAARMQQRHPNWSDRQCYCCLYWQGTARKALKGHIRAFLNHHRGFRRKIITCPEACGCNVTATMKTIGIELEWPPRAIAYQVALVGTPVQVAGD